MPPKIGRNERCPCGSSKKYKYCCLSGDETQARAAAEEQALLDEHDASGPDVSVDDDDDWQLERGTQAGNGDAKELRSPSGSGATVASFESRRQRRRQQIGACALCGAALSPSNAHRHLADCVPAHDLERGASAQVVTIRVMAAGMPAYWLDVEAKYDARLEALDQFLRDIWLECCGHLSLFRIGGTDYFSRGYELDPWPTAMGSGRRSSQRRMTATLRDAALHVAQRFTYEYDFGSTTSLDLRVTGERPGRPGRKAVRLLARNGPPDLPCASCGDPAAYVCPFCLQEEDAAPFVCKQHRSKHRCEDGAEGLLPVVNSPRMGVCGYIGQA